MKNIICESLDAKFALKDHTHHDKANWDHVHNDYSFSWHQHDNYVKTWDEFYIGNFYYVTTHSFNGINMYLYDTTNWNLCFERSFS